MIEIYQHRLKESELCDYYDKMEELSFHMNKELITKDINRLRSEQEVTHNKYNKRNLKVLIKYLESLLKNINNESVFEMCWNNSNGVPVSYPVKMIEEPIYNINTCNYIETGSDEKIVELNLKEIADLIAFEFIFRDLGETHESIEDMLKDCGILGIQPSTLISNHFLENNDNMYYLSKSMKVGETPYESLENHKLNDYFNYKQFNKDGYGEVVEFSCVCISTLIMNNIIRNAIRCGVSCKPIMINATNITFVTNMSNESDIKSKLLEDITLRTFGRRFSIKPIISIF